jgi:hypothetical protein
MFAQESTRAALLSKAGPLALTTGILFTAAQLVMWPFDTDDHVATSQSVVFQVAGAVYFIAFCLLMLTLVLAYAWQAPEAGKLGVAGVTVAAIGTMALGGDLWFESFAVPWIADEAPAAFDTDPTLVLALGAISSYLLFAIGWALFGLASLRAGVFPRSICLAIVVGGLLGYSALLAPFGVPLGLAIIWLGVWMIRTPFEVEAPSSAGTQPPVPVP